MSCKVRLDGNGESQIFIYGKACGSNHENIEYFSNRKLFQDRVITALSKQHFPDLTAKNTLLFRVLLSLNYQKFSYQVKGSHELYTVSVLEGNFGKCYPKELPKIKAIGKEIIFQPYGILNIRKSTLVFKDVHSLKNPLVSALYYSDLIKRINVLNRENDGVSGFYYKVLSYPPTPCNNTLKTNCNFWLSIKGIENVFGLYFLPTF